MSRIRVELERRGLAATFAPFYSGKEDLTVDTSCLPEAAQQYCRRWFRIGLWDFRLGHVVSFVMVCIFLLLAAVWLYPSAVEGRAVMGEIAGIFTSTGGQHWGNCVAKTFSLQSRRAWQRCTTSVPMRSAASRI